jgi:hypothetical protein
LEYCNVAQGTQWSDLRRKHGVAEPYNVKNWCLGNEMDGPWQIGHVTATEYGMKAQDAARQMRAIDPSLNLIACGSSGPGMPTYLRGPRRSGAMLRVRRCSFTASLYRKYCRRNRQRQFEVCGHESQHGKADRGNAGGR